jgi:hypothetical protein
MPVETDADAATLGLAGSSLLDNVASPSPNGHERIERTGFVQPPQQQVLSDVEDGRLPAARAGALWGVAGNPAHRDRDVVGCAPDTGSRTNRRHPNRSATDSTRG